MMFYLQREKTAAEMLPKAQREAHYARIGDARKAHGKPGEPFPDPLTREERDALAAYVYAATAPALTEDDITDPTWGPQSEALPFAEADARTFADLLGCHVTTFAAPEPEPVAAVDPVSARKARVAAHLAAVAEAKLKAGQAA
jgi:hypothetical protein